MCVLSNQERCQLPCGACAAGCLAEGAAGEPTLPPRQMRAHEPRPHYPGKSRAVGSAEAPNLDRAGGAESGPGLKRRLAKGSGGGVNRSMRGAVRRLASGSPGWSAPRTGTGGAAAALLLVWCWKLSGRLSAPSKAPPLHLRLLHGGGSGPTHLKPRQGKCVGTRLGVSQPG